MNQELEQLFNQVQLQNPDMTPADALAQANRTLAEKNEELNETEGEDTPSESSDGTFRFIDQVNFPVAPTESELSNMSPLDRTFAINRYKRDFDAADTLLSDYNASVQEQFQKLQELVKKEESAENRAQIYETFIQETGVDLSEEFSALEGIIQENTEKNERIQSGLNPSF